MVCDGLQVSGVAGERVVGQREAVAGHDQTPSTICLQSLR